MTDEPGLGGSNGLIVADPERVSSGIEVSESRKLALALQEEAGLAGLPATLGASNSKERWQAYSDVPAKLSVEIPLPKISLNELLALKVGTMLVSEWSVSQDVSLLVGEVFLANVSCEPAGERLGVRINGFDQPSHSS